MLLGFEYKIRLVVMQIQIVFFFAVPAYNYYKLAHSLSPLNFAEGAKLKKNQKKKKTRA